MFWRKKRGLDDFAEEIQSHLTLEADQMQGTKEAGANAHEAARRAFGNVTAVQEAFYERGRWLFFDRLLQDLKYAIRLMRNRPGFSAIVVLTLAIGIGANTAIFSLIDAVLLKPLPFRDPSRLAMLWMDDVAHNDREGTVSLPNFRDWRKQSRTFEDMTIFSGQTFLLGTDGSPERLRSARVPANFFPLLGVQPVLGRVFSDDEEKRRERVVLLSYGLWQRRFDGSPTALGQDLTMDGRKSRIVGVMPAQIRFPFADTQVWEPVTAHPYWIARNQSSPRSSGDWFVLGRLKPGTTWSQASAEMDTIGRRLHAEYGDQAGPPGVVIVPLHTQTTGKIERPLTVLFGAVFLMLLIACINVANLLLARGSVREREFALRRSLGASRWRVAAQLLTESLVLAIAGGLLGLSFAAIGLKALIAFGPRDIPRLAEARLDPRVLAFALLLSVFAALTAGLWPALEGGTSSAKGRQWTTSTNRNLRGLLVIGEFSLALVLLAGSGLLIHSFVRLQAVDLGFRPDNLLVMRVDLHVGKTSAQHVAYFERAIEQARTVPGVRSAAATGRFLRSYGEDPIEIEGRPTSSATTFRASDAAICGPYFETAGIPLKQGRFFSDQDREGSPSVAIVNETMARSYWPVSGPLGKRFRYTDSPSNPWITVVGVTGDMHRQGIEKQVGPQVFRPLRQSPDNEMDLVVRTALDPLVLASSVRDAIQSVDKTVAKFGIATAEQQLGEQTAERRFHTSLIGLFSLVALFLSAIGIYGLIHHMVIQRTHEIGVRMALGARYGNVLSLVLSQGLTLAAIGVAVGLAGALVFLRLLSSLLYAVTVTDPLTLLTAPAILLIVAGIACWLPARRAASVDPALALRQD